MLFFQGGMFAPFGRKGNTLLLHYCYHFACLTLFNEKSPLFSCAAWLRVAAGCGGRCCERGTSEQRARNERQTCAEPRLFAPPRQPSAPSSSRAPSQTFAVPPSPARPSVVPCVQVCPPQCVRQPCRAFRSALPSASVSPLVQPCALPNVSRAAPQAQAVSRAVRAQPPKAATFAPALPPAPAPQAACSAPPLLLPLRAVGCRFVAPSGGVPPLGARGGVPFARSPLQPLRAVGCRFVAPSGGVPPLGARVGSPRRSLLRRGGSLCRAGRPCAPSRLPAPLLRSLRPPRCSRQRGGGSEQSRPPSAQPHYYI